jgi:VanZ family protein
MSRIAVPVLPRWLRWAAVVAVAAVIFSLSVVTAPPEDPVVAPPDLLPLDKWRHFLAYAALAGSLAYATVDWEWSPARLAALVVGVAAVYGLGIEGIQATTPDRYFSVGDAYANVLGAVLAAPWFAVRSRVPLVRVPGGDRLSGPDESGREPGREPGE